VIQICGAVLATMVDHCLAEAPIEACGVVAALANDETTDSQHILPMRNALRSPTAYAFVEGDQLAVWRAMDHMGQRPVMIYHSHTASEPVPSKKDLLWASEPDAVYVIVQTAARAADVVVRGWRIEFGGGAYAEVRLELGCCVHTAPIDPTRGYRGNPR
jgi:[CysO sulfur-carrier protein]-S-L-cysteine hydrolase